MTPARSAMATLLLLLALALWWWLPSPLRWAVAGFAEPHALAKVVASTLAGLSQH